MFRDQDLLLRRLTTLYIGRELTDLQTDQFCRFGDMLLKWNLRLNLTRITEPGEVVLKHFVDSMALAKYISGVKVADLGTGAGFPGVPLKILRPELEMVLVDSLNKRLKFLDAVIQTLPLEGVKTVHARLENIGNNPDYRASFDTVTARAVARLPELLEYALPLLKPGGLFLAAKGPQAGAELKEAKEALRLLGGRLESLEQYDLGETAEYHAVVIVRKVNDTPAKYPRRAGTPQKHPLV